MASTSFVFMFVEVPAPPCTTSTTNWSRRCPSRTSCAAWSIASARSASSTPIALFARAAACFTVASASMRSGYTAIGTDVIGKFSSARRVLMPQ